MSLDFVAIDWETANGFRQSPCSVGLVRVRDGEVVETLSSLMRPPERYGYFTPANTAIHGLRAEDVADAPQFEDLWPEMLRWIGDLPLVAHNAAFDIGVIQTATRSVGTHCPSLQFGCTLVLAREHYHLTSYTLDKVAKAARVRLERHHEAAADALAAAQILLTIAEEVRATTLDGTFGAHGITLGTLDGPVLRPCRTGGARGPALATLARERSPDPPALW